MNKLVFLTVCFLSILQAAPGNPPLFEGKQLLKRATLLHEKTQLLQAHAIFERIMVADNENYLARYYLAKCEYELSVHELGAQDFNMLFRYVNSAIAHLDHVLEQKSNWSEAQLLLSNLYGFKIHALQLKGDYAQTQTLGMKSIEYANLALENGTNNPRAYLTMGIIKFNMPQEYGGSAEIAQQYIQKAIDLFAASAPSDSLAPDWGYPESFSWMGQILEKLNKPQEALKSYEQALSIEPDFVWVKYDLLPKLNTRLASEK